MHLATHLAVAAFLTGAVNHAVHPKGLEYAQAADAWLREPKSRAAVAACSAAIDLAVSDPTAAATTVTGAATAAATATAPPPSAAAA